MIQSLCCRFAAPQHLLSFVLAIVVALLCQCVDTHAQELEQAVIRVPKADVYCGPNSDYYSTMQLQRGDSVEIIEKGIDGWVSIVPPSQSFCWIAGRDCKLLPNGKEIEVVAERTVCWIGSTLKQTEYRWQSELTRGARIAIVGEAQRRGEDGSSQLWYRVAPPADELRWVRIEHLGTAEEVAQSAVVTASAQQPVRPSSKPSSEKKEKSVLADNAGKPDRKISLATNYEPIAAPKPPRTLSPAVNEANMKPMQTAASGFQPGPTAAGYFDQEPPRGNSVARPMARPRPTPMGPSTMASRPSNATSMQPVPNWEQFQAFPTQSVGPNGPATNYANTQYQSVPASPLEWIFGDFIHRNDRGHAPAAMRPVPDAYVAQGAAGVSRMSSPGNSMVMQPRSAPYSERNYAPDQPFQSRIAQLPRPRRRSTHSDADREGNVGNLYATNATAQSTWQDVALQAPNSLGQIANSMSQAATADYRSETATNYATATSWHGIQAPGNPALGNPALGNPDLGNTLLASAQSNVTPSYQDAAAPVNISSPELQQIQLALSSEVAKPIEQWNLASYKATIEERLQQSNDPLYRGEARLLIDRIDAFTLLRNRSTHTVPAANNAPTYGPLVPSNPETPAMWIHASQYDASGWLVPVHATHTGQPEYAITDDRGNTLAYVSAQPGVNLRRYLRQPVGLKGRRGYLADLAANHIVVERVVSLQR